MTANFANELWKKGYGYVILSAWEWMGPGGSCGLQNRSFGVNPSMVGSIPTHSRQAIYHLSIKVYWQMVFILSASSSVKNAWKKFV